MGFAGKHLVRRALAVSAVVLIATLAGVLGTGSGQSGLGSAIATAQASGVGCSWFGEADPRDVNTGAPDLNAFYLYAPLDGFDGAQIEITGSYPNARYFSFSLYGNDQNTLSSIYDQQIAPDRGSHNPFTEAVPAGGSKNYTVHVLFENQPANPAPNTLYAGPVSGVDQVGFLLLRIYLPIPSVPVPSSSTSGGVPYPEIHVLNPSGGTELDEGNCATIANLGDSSWLDYANESAPADQSTPANGTTSPPVWTRSFSNGYGNDQNSYLQTLVSHHWGQLVVFHFKAPTFPNTSAGQTVWSANDDLRYWSMCVYDDTGEAGWGCVPDDQAPQTDGWVTFVVSDAAHRPANATAADGVSWLPWGPANEIQIMERNMLPAATFTGASQRITAAAQNPDAAKIMGDYYPTSAYCSQTTFEQGGWQACLPALAKQLAKSGKTASHKPKKKKPEAKKKPKPKKKRRRTKARHR
jgi:uncharacterized membrane protein